MANNQIMSFQLRMNEQGRTVIPVGLRSAARVDIADELFARVVGEGVFLVETKGAVRNRVRANAAIGSHGVESGALMAKSRIEDLAAQQKSWELREQAASEAAARPQEESDAVGDAMLRVLGV